MLPAESEFPDKESASHPSPERLVGQSQQETQAENEELSALNAQLQVKIEELGRAQQAQHQSEERLRLIVESAKDYAIFTLDPERRVTTWNTGAQNIFCYTEEEIIGQPGDILFVPEDRATGVPANEVQKALIEGRAENERWHIRNDGSRFYGSGVTMPLREEDGTTVGFVKIMRDLTQQKRAEDALRYSEEQLRLAVESAQLGTCDWNYQTGVMRGNEQRLALLGLPPQHGPITTEQFRSSLHPEDREKTWNSLVLQIEGQGQHAEEYRVIRADGSVHWVAEAGRVVEWSGDKPHRIASILWDVTTRHEAQQALQTAHDELEARVEERTRDLGLALRVVRAEVEQRRQAEAERTALMRRLVNMQEEERGRISRELHDNLGQHLTAVMLGLQALETQIKTITGGKRQQGAPQLDNLRTLVDGLMRAAHRQAWELRPAELDAMGLEVALEQYISDWSKRTGVPVEFQAVGWEKRPAPEVETTLYRVVQEALTNVARHADASGVSVILEQNPELVSAIIEDNGRGFEPEENKRRLGVLGMQERLWLVGGTLEIESILGDGTTVFARIPLAAQETKA